jgi:NAD(P)-dependent dehydrogenase (short-subunit alcohol dehydrogenase family)
MSNRLSGKVCIIAGTGGGMGRETALAFAREGALVVGGGLFVEEADATVAIYGGQGLALNLCDGGDQTPAIGDACVNRQNPS